MKRRRWQVDLRGEDELTLDRARRALGAEGDSETGRALLVLFTKLAAAVEHGSVISFLPADDPRAVDALPELTRGLRPAADYRWLVSVPHPWRKQLSMMEANGYSTDVAADEFGVPREAVLEAVDYVTRNRALVEAELAEEWRQTEPFLSHRGPAAHAPPPR